jgi:NAD-dependent dihydropyrimidine dehydrogenase PreA subunit
VDNGVDAPKRLSAEVGVREAPEVTEDELYVDAASTKASRIADEDANAFASFDELRQEGLANRPRCPGEQDHPCQVIRLNCASSPCGPAAGRSLRSGLKTYDDEREPDLAYVIAEPCIGQKDNSCVEVCPVDCIHPTPDEPDYESVEQLYIDPDECIDCDACVEACPVDACFAEDQLPDEWSKYTQINAEFFANK